jgi:hypothetical protein
LEHTGSQTPKTLSLFLLSFAVCAFMLPQPVSAGKCSVVRLQSCDQTANADRMRQIRPGRSANARASIRMLRDQGDSRPLRARARRRGLSGDILIDPPDRRSAEILARYGIPSFAGIPPIVIISPDERDKKK